MLAWVVHGNRREVCWFLTSIRPFTGSVRNLLAAHLIYELTHGQIQTSKSRHGRCYSISVLLGNWMAHVYDACVPMPSQIIQRGKLLVNFWSTRPKNRCPLCSIQNSTRPAQNALALASVSFPHCFMVSEHIWIPFTWFRHFVVCLSRYCHGSQVMLADVGENSSEPLFVLGKIAILTRWQHITFLPMRTVSL